MDEPENYAAPVTETRVNPFDAGYRRALEPPGSPLLRFVVIAALYVVFFAVFAYALWRAHQGTR